MKRKFYFIILPILVLCLGAGSLKSTAIQQGLKAMFGDDGKFLRIDVTEVTAPDTPKENKGVIYAKADHKLYYKDENGAESDLTQGVGSGDNVSVNGVGVVDPDFVTTGGQITFTDTSNTVTADITDDTVLEADLKAVNASADEDILTKENTTGDFEWHTPSELGIPSSIENLSFFASTTSAQLAGVISNETGTGVLVYGTTPTFTTSIDVTGGGEIDAGGMNIDASNSFSIANTDVIADSTGTATLSNIDALDATTETTVEAAIDSLPNVTTAAALSTVGVIGSGTWQGTSISTTYTDAKVTSVSGSTGTVADGDIDHDSLANFASNEHFTQANITATGTVASGTWNGTSIGTAYTDAKVTSVSGSTGAVSDGDIDHDSLGNFAANEHFTQANITATGTIATGVWNGTAIGSAYLTSASTTVSGASELATTAETNTGTDTGRTVTPDALAGSYAGTETVQAVVFEFATDTETGNGKYYFHVPASMNGMNLVTVHAEVITAGTTNTTNIQIHNATDGQDMLSTGITIDSTETGSDTAATPAVINASYDDVATNDVIRIDVDQVSSTAAKGLLITMEFRLP